MFYKYVVDNIIVMIGEGKGFNQISETEFRQIKNMFSVKPSDTETISYKLQDVPLEWVGFSIDDEVSEE